MERALCMLLSDNHKGDLKLCSMCEAVNWYENENCHECDSREFHMNKAVVRKKIENEYNFWIKEEDCTEGEADDMVIDI